MENNQRVFYLAAGLVGLLLMVLLVYVLFGRQEILSPLPEETIRVIFSSPSGQSK